MGPMPWMIQRAFPVRTVVSSAPAQNRTCGAHTGLPWVMTRVVDSDAGDRRTYPLVRLPEF